DYTKALYAEDIMPEIIPIKEVDLKIIDSTFYRDPMYDEVWGDVNGSINVTFEDPAESEDYYELSVYSNNEYYDYYDSTLHVNRYKIDFTSNDPLVETSGDYNTTLFFTDEVLNGQNYKLELDFEDWNANGNTKYEVELLCLSRAAYLYRRSIREYNQSSEDPFSEPVVIYSNIENGFGIFAGYNTSNHVVSLF
ncbi:MAG TPA: DUF4249 family protein, partial [Bacteroidales bacterium]|nr:DUF4249 family protein [Bacteroidales bacterium]